MLPGMTLKRSPVMQKLKTYRRIKESADYPGVSPNTVRLWGRDGKIVEYRHPISNYRDLDRPHLTPWERYAQVLLLANEFVFVELSERR